MHENDKDKKLLYENPYGLIEKYQHLIQTILRRYIGSGMFSARDQEEIVQQINEKLLTDKIFRMQKNYDPTYYVVTYFSKIVQNICLDISRNRQKENIFDHSSEIDEFPDETRDAIILNQLTIEEELYRLNTILRLFHRSRMKIELFLKIYSRLPVTGEDISNAFPGAGDADRNTILSTLPTGSQYQEMKEKDIFINLTPIINRVDGKENTTDALRKWVDSKINEIIALLNSEPHNTMYDRETLKILLQHYYR